MNELCGRSQDDRWLDGYKGGCLDGCELVSLEGWLDDWIDDQVVFLC